MIIRRLLLVAMLAAFARPTCALELWYEAPARLWTEALPIGNGQIGAMVFGGAADERIQLNEESLWSGAPQDADNPEALEYLPKVRALLEAGKYEKAEALTFQKLVCKGAGSGKGNGADVAYGSFQTLGDLWLTHPEADETDVTYRSRALNLETSIAETRYELNGNTFVRTARILAEPSLLVISLTNPAGEPFDLDVALDRHPANCSEPWKNNSRRERAGSDPAEALSRAKPTGDHSLLMTGQLWDGKGMRFATQVQAQSREGIITADDSGLHIRGTSGVTLVLAAATNYTGNDPLAVVRDRMQQYAPDAASHTQREQPRLWLGDQPDTPTDERLRNLRRDASDPSLAALYFEFGRHLLRGSSGPSGILPANLQGIWCDHLQAPWNADYHNNINDQMNYWPAEVTGLQKEHEPFLRFIQDLVDPGRKTARIHYGANGWVTHTISNVWGFTSPGEHPSWGAFVGASGWLCQHLWEHYAFNPDLDYLKSAYPTMREAARFYLDFLVEEPKRGWLVTSPSNSPENRFRTADGQEASVCTGPTMDMQIIRELFTNCIAAGELVGEEAAFLQTLRDARDRLAPMQIGKHGQLQEWLEDFEEVEPGHRHISHLYGLYPGDQITPSGTPELAEAARVTLERRLAQGGGHTGWSRAWIIAFYARLHDGDAAHDHLVKLLQKATHPNLFGNHPPLQIDANFGATAAIAEMLIQSHTDEIHLLPALPTAWPDGHFKGFRARGGYTVDATWEDGDLVEATVHGPPSEAVAIRYGDLYCTVTIAPNTKSVRLDPQSLRPDQHDDKEV
jgi:alpha-L-fucosidase 2